MGKEPTTEVIKAYRNRISSEGIYHAETVAKCLLVDIGILLDKLEAAEVQIAAFEYAEEYEKSCVSKMVELEKKLDRAEATIKAVGELVEGHLS